MGQNRQTTIALICGCIVLVGLAMAAFFKQIRTAEDHPIVVENKISNKEIPTISTMDEIVPTEQPIASYSQAKVLNKKVKPVALNEVTSPPPAPPLEAKNESQESATSTESQTDADHRFWVWAGVGISYSILSQDVVTKETIEVAGIQKPTLALRVGAWTTDHSGFDFSYNKTPGKILGTDDFTVTNGDYSWDTLSAEYLYRPSPLTEEKSEINFRFGLQSHQLPFVLQTATDSIFITTSTVNTISLGVEYKRELFKDTRIEGLFRYQFPLSSSATVGENYHVDSSLVFDGSVGAVHLLTSNLYLGTYWHGQWHSYDFTYSNDLNPNLNMQGHQNLFHSTIDLRLGWEF